MTTFKARLEPFAFPLLALVFTCVVFAFYVYTPMPAYYRESLDSFLQWTVPRPFVYRVLTALALQVLVHGFSLAPEAAGLVIAFLSLCGFEVTFWYLAKRFLPPARAQQITLLAPLALCAFFVVFRQVYDFPILFLFTAGLTLLAYQKNFWYLLLLPLVCLCKETAFLLIFFWAVHFWSRSKNYFILLGLQLAIFGIIRLALMWVFRNNPGGELEFHLLDQIHFSLANPLLTLALFVFAGAVIALAAYQFPAKPKFLRDATLTIAIPIFILYILFGFPFELRIFLEALPVLLLVCVPPRLAREELPPQQIHSAQSA